jgi:hypothetical protein
MGPSRLDESDNSSRQSATLVGMVRRWLEGVKRGKFLGERRDEGRLDGEVPAPPDKLAVALLM